MKETHNSRSSENSFSDGPAGPSSSPDAQTTLFVAALQQAVRELHATTAIAVVPVGDGETLASAVVVGRPLSIFTTIEHISVDARLASATAHRTGCQFTYTFTEAGGDISEARGDTPSRFDVTMPFPYTVAATPLRASGRRFGTMTLVWAPPLGPRSILPADKERCTRIADALARSLEASGYQDPSGLSPAMPQFFLALPDLATWADGTGNAGTASGQEEAPEAISMTFLYRIYRLASRLNQCEGVRDILDVVASRVLEAFGAKGMAVSVTQGGRSHLLGYSGYPGAVARSLIEPPAAAQSANTTHPPTDRPTFLECEDDLADKRLNGLTDTIRACCLLPLVSGRARTGTLTLGFDRPRCFSAEERTALVTMAELLAQALERANRFDAEHHLARGLQQGLLPARLPHLEELDIATRYVTATAGTAVGGDWYDVLSLPDGNVGLVIGDVEGHNPNAAAYMGQIRSAVRAYAAVGHRPADLLGRTNRLLADLSADMFATCCCVWVDLDIGTAEFCSAGHPTPLLCHPDQRVVVPGIPVGLPLGVMPDTAYQAMEVPLPDGTILALYTDGLVHSRALALTDGTAALGDLLASATDERLEDLATRLLLITGTDEARGDDAALLLARYAAVLPGSRPHVSRFLVDRHDLRAVRDVRRFLHQFTVSRGWDTISDDLELAATEVVTNALVHADSEVDIRLREYGDRIRVEVRDSDPRPPMPMPITLSETVNTSSEHGRGLIIVEALASAWGNSPSGRGKTVWFEMSRPGAERPEHSGPMV